VTQHESASQVSSQWHSSLPGQVSVLIFFSTRTAHIARVSSDESDEDVHLPRKLSARPRASETPAGRVSSLDSKFEADAERTLVGSLNSSSGPDEKGGLADDEGCYLSMSGPGGHFTRAAKKLHGVQVPEHINSGDVIQHYTRYRASSLAKGEKPKTSLRYRRTHSLARTFAENAELFIDPAGGIDSGDDARATEPPRSPSFDHGPLATSETEESDDDRWSPPPTTTCTALRENTPLPPSDRLSMLAALTNFIIDLSDSIRPINHVWDTACQGFKKNMPADGEAILDDLVSSRSRLEHLFKLLPDDRTPKCSLPPRWCKLPVDRTG
jgi:hypothetical protein